MSPSSCHAGFLDAVVSPPIKRGQKSLYPTIERIYEDNVARSQVFSRLRILFREWPEIPDKHSCSVHKPHHEILNPSGFLASPGLRTLLLCQPK